VPDFWLRNQPTLRRWAWPFTIGLLVALTIVVVALSVIAFIQRGQLSDADRRLDTIETGTRIAEVATCYATARGRPVLADLLGVLASSAPTAAERAIVNGAIRHYVRSARTVQECDKLAVERGLDPRDFPPPPESS